MGLQLDERIAKEVVHQRRTRGETWPEQWFASAIGEVNGSPASYVIAQSFPACNGSRVTLPEACLTPTNTKERL